MRRVLSFLAGFLVGGLVGAGVGVLMAPQAGTELQDRIRGRIDDLLLEGRKAAAERQTELQAQLEAFKAGKPVTLESNTESG